MNKSAPPLGPGMEQAPRGNSGNVTLHKFKGEVSCYLQVAINAIWPLCVLGCSHQIQGVRKFVPRYRSGSRAGVSPSQKYTPYHLPIFNRARWPLSQLPVSSMRLQCSYCLGFRVWLCLEFIQIQESCFRHYMRNLDVSLYLNFHLDIVISVFHRSLGDMAGR